MHAVCNMIWSIHRSHRSAGKEPIHYIVGLPRCNMNSKIQILGKSKVLTEKSLTESHFRQTNISRDLLSVCEVRRSDKCFAVIYLKLLVQIDSLFSVKYCRRRKKSPQTFLDAKTVVKTGQTTPIKFLLDDVVT